MYRDGISENSFCNLTAPVSMAAIDLGYTLDKLESGPSNQTCQRTHIKTWLRNPHGLTHGPAHGRPLRI
jgi:hypothetical protein